MNAAQPLVTVAAANAASSELWLQAVLSLAQHYRLQVSAQAVRSVLQWSVGRDDADTTLHLIARQAGMSLHFEAVPKTFRQDRLPMVVELADGSIHVLLAILADGRYRSINAAEVEVEVALDVQQWAGQVRRVATLRPLIDVADARVDDYIKPYRPHWFWRIALRDWRRYGDVMLASLAANILALAGIMFSMQVYDRVVPAKSIPTLWVLFIGVLIAIAFEFGFRMLRAYISDRVGKRADVALSDVVFGRALRTRSDARPASTGMFIAQIRELESVRELLTSTTIGAVADLPFFILFIGVLYAMAGSVAGVALAAVPLIVIPGLLLQIPLARLSREGMRESALRNAVLIEAVQGMDDIKLMSAEPRFQAQWNYANVVSANIGMKQRFVTYLLTTWTQEVQGLVYAVVLLVGSVLVMNGDITTGVLVGASILASRMISPLAQLSGIFARWQQAKVALDGIDNLMSRPLDHPEDQQLTSRSLWRGDYALSGVRFGYSQEQTAPTLAIDALQIKAGERVAVLGKMGSGKSTLMQMLSGLLPPQAGVVMLDSVPLSQIDPADVRRDMGVLPQTAQLFHGTVRDNLLMGAPRADDAALIQALTLAGGAGLLASSPKGLDSPITEGGRGLSGGQRQTLLLARALLRNPRIVLLDEPTASYDEISERSAIAALKPWLQGRTLVVATHRPALLELVERIIVIDGGRVVMDGPRDKVLEALRR